MPGLLFFYARERDIMPRKTYRSGDTVVLKTGAMGKGHPTGPCRITTVMPESQGVVRYRVQFAQESFERSISGDEIDADASVSRPRDAAAASSQNRSASWVNPAAIKIRK